MYQDTSISWEEMQERRGILLSILSDLTPYWDKAEFFIALIKQNLMNAEHMKTLSDLIDDVVKEVKNSETLGKFLLLKDQIVHIRMQESQEKAQELSELNHLFDDSFS